jgi:hypothetical protein
VVLYVLVAGLESESQAQIFISRAYPPVVVQEPADKTLAEGGNLLLSARVAGSEPIRYQW